MINEDIIVSTVIPIYNGEPYLERTIKSLLNQTFHNFEIICVNYSSTDNSLAILNQLNAIDHRVKVYTKENGGKAASAVKFGLQYCIGKYFMYSTQDDLFSADLLEKGINSALKFDSDAVVPNMVLYHSDLDLNISGDYSNLKSVVKRTLIADSYELFMMFCWNRSKVAN